jgi:hypothetical protein
MRPLLAFRLGSKYGCQEKTDSKSGLQEIAESDSETGS